MKAPESLETLVDYGIIQEVVRPLMSGKEAQVYVVVADGEECVAKVYKEANQRTFKHRADYTEGRRTRNSRDQRAMTKRTLHGRKKDEDAWRTTEVEMIYRLRDAGVRVPKPLNFVEGVLVMELVKNADGHAAPRLGDLNFSPAEARGIYQQLIREVIRMLCAGVIHGDLSDFNVLMSHDGPVVIDFPQAVDPTHNANGQKLLLRDVENLHRFLARFAPGEPRLPYGEEIWSLFKANRLKPDTALCGLYQAPAGKADTQEVMALIEDASRDERKRRAGPRSDEDEEFEAELPSRLSASFRKVVDFTHKTRSRSAAKPIGGTARDVRPTVRGDAAAHERVARAGPASGSAPKRDAASTGSRHDRRGGSRLAEPPRGPRDQGSRSEAKKADVATPGKSRSRRRTRRDRPHDQANAGSKPGRSPAPNNQISPRGKTTPASEATGEARRSPRRRRRPRKARPPE